MSRGHSDRAWRLNAVAVACAAAALILETAVNRWGNPLDPLRLGFLGLPATLCAIPLATRRPVVSQVSRIAVGVVLWPYSAFFGFLFLPSSILMLVAAASGPIRTRPVPRRACECRSLPAEPKTRSGKM